MRNIQLIRPFNSILHPYIECYLFPKLEYKTLIEEDDGVLEVLPSPNTSIILFFSEPSHYMNNEKLEKYNEFIFTGYYSSPKKIVRSSSLDQMIIKFTPIGIQLLLGFQVSEIIDTYVSIKEVFRADFISLISKLRNARTNTECVISFEKFMINKLSQTKPIDKRAIALVNYITKRNNSKGLSQISLELGIGERTIQRIIQKYVGINYKYLSKLIRFQEARKLLSRNNYKNNTSQLAYELNYFDQAHFIHDFKTFSNLTPSQFIDKQNSNQLFDIPNRITF